MLKSNTQSNPCHPVVRHVFIWFKSAFFFLLHQCQRLKQKYVTSNTAPKLKEALLFQTFLNMLPKICLAIIQHLSVGFYWGCVPLNKTFVTWIKHKRFALVALVLIVARKCERTGSSATSTAEGDREGRAECVCFKVASKAHFCLKVSKFCFTNTVWNEMRGLWRPVWTASKKKKKKSYQLAGRTLLAVSNS